MEYVYCDGAEHVFIFVHTVSHIPNMFHNVSWMPFESVDHSHELKHTFEEGHHNWRGCGISGSSIKVGGCDWKAQVAIN